LEGKGMTKILGSLLLIPFLLLGFAGTVAAQGLVSGPTSDAGVVPYIIDGANPGGNRTCSEVGQAFHNDQDYFNNSTSRIDYENPFFSLPFPAGLTVDVFGGKTVSWQSTFPIGAVIVKGGNSANVYYYAPQAFSDEDLASPINRGGKVAGLSNLTFCWRTEVVSASQWCSPGYWKQDHHLDSWDDIVGISPNDTYSSHFGGEYLVPSKKGEDDGAPTDPSLLVVLNNPNWYKGDAQNSIADLLSTAHPDVTFTGERIEDSCPLN
jgi:hypothetical protein